ncbi:4-galactosyl-N-acetylglucosaminide 3-alpha-L-fucosyltransferase FUT6 [Lepeophtheirus salmonis]|uniref:4-galactosyl-N-acetylglucosaminide 3-alpha-L-fucosyltransferase FUT6 n=1 Tax=Lepeophtheirus salmonis TaxID=72036 RepID=UPI001AE67F27|nr:4-galactosyl-N-acetylglucosaminide 3-alpha-L-fucosyltransferase FUT6-like [Lepeophtheirus salmonis]
MIGKLIIVLTCLEEHDMKVNYYQAGKLFLLILVMGFTYNIILKSSDINREFSHQIMDLSHNISNFERIITEEEPLIREENVKYIFYYTSIYGGSWELIFGYGRQPFAKCEYNNCFLTQDNSKPIPFHKYSATLIHARDCCSSDIANSLRRSRREIKGPFIHYTMESANYDCRFDFRLYNEVFNWTMGYHPYADIPSMYGNTYSVKKKQPIPDLIKIMKIKHKLAFWIATHVGSAGKRDDYVRKLQKYMTVDKYGLSGPNFCPDSPNPMRIDCKKHHAPYYKFYFAFENSLCRDYVTEKFFHALRLPVVPVVYGKSNYTAVAPPHSFIDVRDFKSPKAVAEYLMYLDKNDTAYLEYFKWKLEGRYKITSFDQEAQKTLCILCDRLNNLQHKRAYTTSQMNEYWKGTKESPVCSSPEELIPGFNE